MRVEGELGWLDKESVLDIPGAARRNNHFTYSSPAEGKHRGRRRHAANSDTQPDRDHESSQHSHLHSPLMGRCITASNTHRGRKRRVVNVFALTFLTAEWPFYHTGPRISPDGLRSFPL